MLVVCICAYDDLSEMCNLGRRHVPMSQGSVALLHFYFRNTDTDYPQNLTVLHTKYTPKALVLFHSVIFVQMANILLGVA